MDYKVNQLKRDEFGRVDGIIAVNKPANITSHDVVDVTRRALGTRKVGHAGALDPFATGVLLILVGKATKLSDSFINTGKEYIMELLLGISTNSGDTEGEITNTQIIDGKVAGLEEVLTRFTPVYEQYVPVFSSIKVDGQKLRVLARKYDSFEIFDKDNERFVRFKNDTGEKIVRLPKHACKLPHIEILSQEIKDILGTRFGDLHKDQLPTTVFPTAKIKVACSKGTYIRTLAEDIGAALTPPLPAMLINLQRTRVGDFDISQSIEIDDIQNL